MMDKLYLQHLQELYCLLQRHLFGRQIDTLWGERQQVGKQSETFLHWTLLDWLESQFSESE